MTSPADVEAHLPALRRYAWALTRDVVAADDLVQDALVRGLERIASYRPERPLKAWLLAVMHSQFIDDCRRSAAERRRDASLVADLPPPPPDPEHAAYLGEIAARFDALPDHQRAPLHLIAVEGLSYAEAAAALDVPIGTVMSRLSRARAALRRDETADSGPRLRIVGGTDD